MAAVIPVRVLRGFHYYDARGTQRYARPGRIFNAASDTVESLIFNGFVDYARPQKSNNLPLRCTSSRRPVKPPVNMNNAAAPLARTLRIGCWLWTSTHYSGGRLLVYQYALSCAQLGADVFFITNAVPRWVTDYPVCNRLKFLINGKDQIPPDLDICMTDSKGGLGLQAAAYKAAHPGCKLVCLNFETENWVRNYVPRVADLMNTTHTREGYSASDLLLGCSELSMRYCREWMGETGAERLYDYLVPAVNDYALHQPCSWQPPERPYALWSARNTDYKCAGLAFDAVYSLKMPFDLVTFGDPGSVPVDTDLHKWHSLKNFPDSVKYDAMRHAHMVLAPSLFEGFGMVPAESLAAGTQVVVYDLPVLRWAYGDRLHYVPWGNEKAFVRKVKKLAAKPKPDLAESSRWVVETYGLGAMQKAVERLPYHSLQTRKISACMICYGTPTATKAVEAVYPHVHEILIAYGPVELYRGSPENGVLEQLRALPDPEHKIKIDARPVWVDKREMRASLAARITGNYQLVLDADEIWVGLEYWQAAFACPRWINLWHTGDFWIHDAEPDGTRWGGSLGVGSVCSHYRFSWWRPSYRWRVHHSPVDAAGNHLHTYTSARAAQEANPYTMIYHLGHCLSSGLMRAKHSFYEARDNAPADRRLAWEGWDGKLGPCPDGIVAPVTWPLPQIVQEAVELSRFCLANAERVE